MVRRQAHVAVLGAQIQACGAGQVAARQGQKFCVGVGGEEHIVMREVGRVGGRGGGKGPDHGGQTAGMGGGGGQGLLRAGAKQTGQKGRRIAVEHHAVGLDRAAIGQDHLGHMAILAGRRPRPTIRATRR